MRFDTRSIGILGVFVLSAVGCSGSSPAQPSGDLPAAVARGAHRLSGVRRAVAGCSGTGTDSFVGGMGGNVAAALDSGVLSGFSNDACDPESGIVAGTSNRINSSGSADNELIGGGADNAISGGIDAFIGGGYSNKVSGQYASILGGTANTASGTESTVVGGGANTASGYSSFAAGYHADANQAGSFVWSDNSSSNATKATAAHQFIVRSAGGVTIYSNSSMTNGVTLPPGSSAWQGLVPSDRAIKVKFAPISEAAILDKIAAMPITEWSYIAEHGIRHVGPMAQDFRAAFGLGENDKQIMPVDEGGVGLAAIKALNARLAQTNARLSLRIARTETLLAQKDASLRKLQLAVAALSKRIGVMR